MEQHDLHSLKDIFANKDRAVVVGNGPSVLNINWEKINDSTNREKTLFLACNRISILFNKTRWRPDIYACFTAASLTEKPWQQSIDECLQDDKIVSLVFDKFRHKTKLKTVHNNVVFAKKVTEHYRHDPIKKNFINLCLTDGILKSYSATSPLFQICNFLNIKTIGIIGQDGYIYDRGQNHFDKSYGYETSNMLKANKRIVNLHKELAAYFKKNDVSVFNHSRNSVLKDLYPYLTLEEFIKKPTTC